MDFAGDHDNSNVAQVYYAAGNGLYLNDANFDNTANNRKAKVYVNREDAGSNTVSGWRQGKALIDSLEGFEAYWIIKDSRGNFKTESSNDMPIVGGS